MDEGQCFVCRCSSYCISFYFGANFSMAKPLKSLDIKRRKQISAGPGVFSHGKLFRQHCGTIESQQEKCRKIKASRNSQGGRR